MIGILDVLEPLNAKSLQSLGRNIKRNISLRIDTGDMG